MASAQIRNKINAELFLLPYYSYSPIALTVAVTSRVGLLAPAEFAGAFL
jgi:hypothetical protein